MSSQKKHKKSASPLFQRIWSEEDELSLLKGLVDFGKTTDKFEWDAFYNFIQDSLHAHFSKEQVVSKIQKLKKKKKFMEPTHSLFSYANSLWGSNARRDDEEEKEEEEHVQVPNAQPPNENAETEPLTPALQDAFETLLSHGLTDFQKQLHLHKLTNIPTPKRKDLSDEWGALCMEEARLNLKKLRFSLKLAEALTH